MRRSAAILLAATVTTLGAAGVAATIPGQPATRSFGAEASTLTLAEVWISAERDFVRIDVDADGIIDVDEYAAQAVVYAGVTRLSGLVPIEGRQVVHIALPNGIENELSAAERVAIDAVARQVFFAAVAERGPLGIENWVALKLRDFADADFDEDGRLTGRELSAYAMRVARYSGSAVKA